jgi:hypothetical protein
MSFHVLSGVMVGNWSAIRFGDPKDKDRYPIKFDEPEHYDARLKAVL